MRADSSVDVEGSDLRRARVATGSFLVWTVFVWTGRVRNALADPALVGSQKLGPLLLSASFLVPAGVLGVAWLTALRRRCWMHSWASVLMRVFASWTVFVWVLRVTDIVMGGDWGVAFIIVHSVLAVVSACLAIWSAVEGRRVGSVTVGAVDR